MCTQVPGCPADPAADGAYFMRNNICRAHCSAAEIDLPGGPFRFCQQCHQLQHVSEFDGMRKSCRAGLSSHRKRSRLRQIGQLAIEAAAGPDSGSDSGTSGDEDETSAAAQSKPLARQQQQQQPANQQQQQQQPQQQQQQEQEQPSAALESLEPDGEHWLLPLDLPPLDQILHLPDSGRYGSEPHLPVRHDMLGAQATHDMHGFMGLQADLGAAETAAGSAQQDASHAFADTMFAAMAADARAGQDQQPCGTPACPAAGGGGAGGSCVDAAGFAAQQQQQKKRQQQGGCGGGFRSLAASTTPSSTPPHSTSSCCDLDISIGLQQRQQQQWAIAGGWQQLQPHLQLCSPHSAPAGAALPQQLGSGNSVSTADRSKRARIGFVAVPQAAAVTVDGRAGVQQVAGGRSERSIAMHMLLSMLQDSPAADPEAELRMLLQSSHKQQQQQQEQRKRIQAQQQQQQQWLQLGTGMLGLPLNGCAPCTSIAATASSAEASRPPACFSAGMPVPAHLGNVAAMAQASMQQQQSSISGSARTLDRLSAVLSVVPKHQLALLRTALERAEGLGAEPDLDTLLSEITRMRSYPGARPQQLPQPQLRRAVSQAVSSSGHVFGASMGRSHSDDARLAAVLRAMQQDGLPGVQLGEPLLPQPLLPGMLVDHIVGCASSSAAAGSRDNQFQTGAGMLGAQLVPMSMCDLDGFRPQPLLPAFSHQQAIQQQAPLAKRQLLQQRLEEALASAAAGAQVV